MKANIADRDTVARIYPPDAFAADAAENDRAQEQILRGVRVLSAPDADGQFEFERAARHTGEVPGAIFLAPFHRRFAVEYAASDPEPQHGYEAFLDDIIAAAQHGFRAEAAPGRGDRRLRRARQ